MKALPWILAGVVGVGGVGATLYFVLRKPAGTTQAPKAAINSGNAGGTNWGAVAQGAGQAIQGITGALGSIFGS